MPEEFKFKLELPPDTLDTLQVMLAAKHKAYSDWVAKQVNSYVVSLMGGETKYKDFLSGKILLRDLVSDVDKFHAAISTFEKECWEMVHKNNSNGSLVKTSTSS